MSMVDCSVDPGDFAERLHDLYPHTLYRHWNPVQDGRLTLPIGLPDEAFDRVVCRDALEGLSEPERQALMTALGAHDQARGMARLDRALRTEYDTAGLGRPLPSAPTLSHRRPAGRARPTAILLSTPIAYPAPISGACSRDRDPPSCRHQRRSSFLYSPGTRATSALSPYMLTSTRHEC